LDRKVIVRLNYSKEVTQANQKETLYPCGLCGNSQKFSYKAIIHRKQVV